MHTQYQTSPSICIYMVQLAEEIILDNKISFPVAYEPTPGQYNLVRALNNSTVIQNVFHTPNYFLRDFLTKPDVIVANPPFSKPSVDLSNAPEDWKELKGMAVGYKFLEEFMEMCDNIVILMPWFTISDSDVRFRKIREFGLISVTPLPRKTFDHARIQTVILQMQKGYTGETKFHTHLI